MFYFHSEQSNFFTFLTAIINPLITLLAGLSGALIGATYGLKQIRLQRKLDFTEKQLREFYSPLLGIHKEIEAKGLARFEIQQKGNEVFAEKDDESLTRDNIPFVDKEIDYNNKQFEEDMLPKYRKMLDIFRDNIGFAEPETLEYYPQFVEFIEVWNRHLEKSIDPDVIKKMNHTEKTLQPFYKELEDRTALLKQKLIE